MVYVLQVLGHMGIKYCQKAVLTAVAMYYLQYLKLKKETCKQLQRGLLSHQLSLLADLLFEVLELVLQLYIR